MKVPKNLKFIGISMLLIVGLVACGKQGATESAGYPMVVGSWRCYGVISKGVNATDIT